MFSRILVSDCFLFLILTYIESGINFAAGLQVDMSSINSATQRKTNGNDEEAGIHPISHVKSAGAMTISPELFEKVTFPFLFPLVS